MLETTIPTARRTLSISLAPDQAMIEDIGTGVRVYITRFGPVWRAVRQSDGVEYGNGFTHRKSAITYVLDIEFDLG